MSLIVTIDGPSASGKTSVARRVAEALGVPFVSSGLLYRGIAYQVLRYRTPPTDAEAVLELLAAHPVRLVPRPGGNQVLANGEDVTVQLHTSAVDAVVSTVARHPEVRAYVKARLAELEPPFVVEGRDMGTAVFPRARFKFYLTASPRVRAQRRARERGEDVTAIEAALRARDEADKAQSQPAPDAVMIDTSAMDLEEVVRAVLERIQERG